MPSNPTRPLARHLISAVLRHGGGAGPPDRELLARFVASRDEEAFAELVRRHGAMVLAACRRVTGHSQDAEDAFQAAFLVLARRAGQIARPELLGNWLYGVAFRTGLEARAARRRAKEQQPVSDIPDLPARDDGLPDAGDLRRVIDEELARLPDKYRMAVVLCDLEGLSRKDAATRLRIPEGTLSSRLNHARKVLAVRLSRRGITTSAGAITAAFTGDVAGTTVSSQLVLSTARAAARFAAGGAVPPEFVSTHVTTLTDGVMKAMIVNRLRLTLGVLVLGLMGIGAAATLAQRPAPAPQPNNPFTPAADPALQPTVKGKAAEKVAAKGIEDDDVPYPSFPAQAVVRLEEGKLVVRQRTRGYAVVANGEAATTVVRQMVTTVSGYKYDPADVSVFDMKGNRVQPKVWKEKLKEDQHVLVAFDGRLPQPRELALLKDDVLLVVFPGHPGGDAVTIPGYGEMYRLRQAPDGSRYYEPYGPPSPASNNIPRPPGYETPTPTIPAGSDTIPPAIAPNRTAPPDTVPTPN
jgi:RNA polymerase sigma factor (sigma-70 family)